jgi:site-specific recombinase XerD
LLHASKNTRIKCFYHLFPFMWPFRKFREQYKCEQTKKSRQWTISEEQVLSPHEIKTLRHFGRLQRNKGLRNRKFNLIRNWFMVELGLFTGLRVQEMTDLKVSDMIIHDEHSSLEVRNGKGGKARSVCIGTGFKETYLKYLKYREQLGLSNAPNHYLLSSSTNKKVTTRCIQKAFKKWVIETGLSTTYHPHTLRHTYATELLEYTNIRVVQEQLGHVSILTTQTYTRVRKHGTHIALEKMYK